MAQLTKVGSRRGRRRAGRKSLFTARTPVEVTLLLRSRADRSTPASSLNELVLLAPSERSYLSHADFEQRFGTPPEDLQRVGAFAHQFGLTVIEAHRAKQVVRLRGSASAVGRAFQVRWKTVRSENGWHRVANRPPKIPAELKGLVEAALGFDQRPAAKPHFRSRRILRKKNVFQAEDVSDAVANGLTAPEIAQLYDFPKSAGEGQCIGVIALMNATDDGQLGGGYLSADLDLYFKQLGIPAPTVIAVPVAGGDCAPGISVAADKEISLDVEVAGAVAPGATIAVYFAPNTTDGFYNALAAAVHDTVNRPKIISISWGMPESMYPKSWMAQFSKLVADAASLGITLCGSSGDWGSSGFAPDDADNAANVMFPSSDPYIVACGGTTITMNNSAIVQETAWNQGDSGGAGGGGVSGNFPVPPWQQGLYIAPQVPLNGRGVPDLAACGDQSPGYQIIFRGKPLAVGGTSAVAPLLAGFFARVNTLRVAAGLPTLGCITPQLYQRPELRAAFRAIEEGDNDIRGTLKRYHAGAGWNACCGLGAPKGSLLSAALAKI